MLPIPNRLRRLIVIGLVILLAGGIANPASAGVFVDNTMESALVASDGIDVYDYSSATKQAIDTTTDWDGGTYDGTVEDGGSIALERFGDVAPQTSSWWDTDWRTRQCYELDNTAAGSVALTEYQFEVELDTANEIGLGWMQSGGEDLRALADDDTTVLPIWVEGPVPSTASTVWVQVDSVPVGVSSFCLYWNNATAPDVSDKAGVFSYSNPTPIYYAVGERYNAQTVPIISYANGNQVQVSGGAVQTINEGAIANIGGFTQNSVVSVTAPIMGRGVGQGTESLIPISFADTTFVIPTNRGVQRYSIVAPFASANVQISNGATPSWTGVVNPGAGVSVTADVSGGRSAVIRSSEPILVVHHATNGIDALVGVRWTGDDLFGVRSRYTYYGYETIGTSALGIRSDGTSQTVVSPADGSLVAIYEGTDLDGDGTAIRITDMTGRTSGTQQADRDGSESTAFLPEGMLDNEYWIPTQGNYVTMACPVPGTQLQVSGFGVVPCNGAGASSPGHGYAGANSGGTIAAGTHIESVGGEPFFAYWEHTATSDETNVFGAKAARKWARVQPTVTVGPREGIHSVLPNEGMWTSGAIDAGSSGVYGLLDWDATVPLGTSIRFQIASGPSAAAAASVAFVGPDGTPATFYDIADDPIAYGHDLDRWYRVKAWLSTSNPLLSPVIDEICVGVDLQEFAAHPASATISSPAGTTSHTWVARVRADAFTTPAGMAAQVRHRGDFGLVNLASAEVFLDGPADQVLVAGSAVSQSVGPPVPWGSTSAGSVGIDAVMNGGATQLEVTWFAADPTGGPLIEHDLNLLLNG